MPTYDLTERTIGDLQREVERLRDTLREIISMCSGQSGTPWKVKELATHTLGAPPSGSWRRLPMIFYVSGTARVDFTQRVEAENAEEAKRKVQDMNVVDLTWDFETINVSDVVQQAKKEK